MTAKKIFLILIFALLYLAPLLSQQTDQGVLSPSELMTEALAASGVDSDQIDYYLEKIELLTSDYKSFIDGKDKSQIAEDTLPYLYEVTLDTYMSLQTTINELLDNRTYNCVSSTIMYLYFMKVAGIPCTAIKTTDHAFCEVTLNGKNIRVETTNPYGFQPGVKKETDIPSRYLYVPAKMYARQKKINDREAVSLIYNNRISTLLKTRDFTKALEVAEQNRNLMMDSRDSLELIQDCAINYLADFARTKDCDNGLAFAETFNSQYGLGTKAKINVDTLVSLKVQNLLNEKKFNDSYEFIKSKTNLMSEKNAAALMKNTVQFQANYIYTERGYDAVRDFLNSDETLNNMSQKDLEKELNYFSNFEAKSIHNIAVPYFNSQRYEEAKAIIEAGIEKLGPHATLVKDLNSLKKIGY